MKKLICVVSLLLSLTFVLSACNSNASTAKIEQTVFGSDITHDGNKDTVKVSLSGLEKGNGEVKIFTKDSAGNHVVLWKTSVGTKEEAQKGVYICKKDGEKDILIWQPSVTEDGKTKLEYTVFYIYYDETSERISVRDLETDNITFTADEVKKDGKKYDTATAFVKKLNKYLSRSFALIDTVGGDAVYSVSTHENKYKLYHPDWYDTSNDEKTVSSASSSSSDSTSSTTSVDETSGKSHEGL